MADGICRIVSTRCFGEITTTVAVTDDNKIEICQQDISYPPNNILIDKELWDVMRRMELD